MKASHLLVPALLLGATDNAAEAADVVKYTEAAYENWNYRNLLDSLSTEHKTVLKNASVEALSSGIRVVFDTTQLRTCDLEDVRKDIIMVLSRAVPKDKAGNLYQRSPSIAFYTLEKIGESWVLKNLSTSRQMDLEPSPAQDGRYLLPTTERMVGSIQTDGREAMGFTDLYTITCQAPSIDLASGWQGSGQNRDGINIDLSMLQDAGMKGIWDTHISEMRAQPNEKHSWGGDKGAWNLPGEEFGLGEIYKTPSGDGKGGSSLHHLIEANRKMRDIHRAAFHIGMDSGAIPKDVDVTQALDDMPWYLYYQGVQRPTD